MNKEFKRHLEENIKGISDSVVFANLYSEGMKNFREDPWPVIQLAIAIMLDKPIVLINMDGRKPPAKLIAIADKVINAKTPEEVAKGVKEYIVERGL